MSEYSSHQTMQHCPKCEAVARPDVQTGQAPSFCLHCRFPLMLVAGKYRLLRVLGEGGFATVYEACDVHNPNKARCVAKILKPELMAEPGMKARFDREVQVTSKLSRNSQHIIRIFEDFGDIPQLGAYYVMEYLDGLPLSEIIDQADGLLPLIRSYHLFEQLCEAMAVAHREDVVHRDLKPENLFIIKDTQHDDWLKVIDFGIAKPLGTEKAVTKLTHGVLGTPAYMAPELYMNRPVGPYTDIYAMGIILFELLVGHTPFAPPHLPAPSAAALMASHVMEGAPSMLPLLPPEREVPEAVDQVVRKALAKQPTDRFSSAHAFLEAFLAAVAGLPLPAGVVPPMTEDYSEDREFNDEIGEGTALDHDSFADLISGLSPDHRPNEATVVQKMPGIIGGLGGGELVGPDTPSGNVVLAPEVFATFPEGNAAAGGLAPASAHDPMLNEAYGDVMIAAEEAEGTAIASVADMQPVQRSYSPMTIEDLPALPHPPEQSGAQGVTAAGQSSVQVEGAVTPSITTKEPAPTVRKLLWILPVVGAVGVLLFLGVWWLLLPTQTQPLSRQPALRHRQPPPQQPHRINPPTRQPLAAKQVSPDRSQPRPLRPQPPVLRIPSWPDTRPQPAPVVKRRAKSRARRRRRRKRRRRRRRRSAKQCPRRSRLFWIYLTFARGSRGRVGVQFQGKGRRRGRKIRRRRGLCVGVPSPSMRVILSLSGKRSKYDSCSFAFSRYAPRAHIRFQKREGDLVAIDPDLCLKKR